MGLSNFFRGNYLRAWSMQKAAPYAARYGENHRYWGNELPAPTRIKVATRHGLVRCEVYRPLEATDPLPAYVHFHGGAFLMRYPQMDDFFARAVAAELGAVVVNVDYDVAPQKHYPVAQEQCHDVAAWVATADNLPGVDQTRVALGGFSAGGNLAASAALQARDLGTFSPACQLLGVPSLNIAQAASDKVSANPAPMIGPRLLDLVRSTYFPDVASRSSPYASPLLAPDLAGLPPAVVITAEHDLLRAEGDAYAARLASSGVEVLHHVVTGADHYFLDAGPAPARDTLRLMLDGVAKHLEPAGTPRNSGGNAR